VNQTTNNQHFDYAQCKQPTLRLRSVQATNNQETGFLTLLWQKYLNWSKKPGF